MNKALILFSFFCLSCWDGQRNGRRYDLVKNCISSHSEIKIQQIYQNGQLKLYPYPIQICDSSRIDTIWEK